jgi:hypothetical protein
MLSTVPSTGGLKKTGLISGFKNPHKTIRETRKENQPENRVYAQEPRLKMALKNSISGTREHSEGTVQEWKMKGGKE